ncbi:hypothetical protein B0H13DRAFT_2265009 [Mycena leptocephala]|nr:hypothetical protein B0H13DRAFT_2265009 [Mycena leptocephala]
MSRTSVFNAPKSTSKDAAFSVRTSLHQQRMHMSTSEEEVARTPFFRIRPGLFTRDKTICSGISLQARNISKLQELLFQCGSVVELLLGAPPLTTATTLTTCPSRPMRLKLTPLALALALLVLGARAAPVSHDLAARLDPIQLPPKIDNFMRRDASPSLGESADTTHEVVESGPGWAVPRGATVHPHLRSSSKNKTMSFHQDFKTPHPHPPQPTQLDIQQQIFTNRHPSTIQHHSKHTRIYHLIPSHPISHCILHTAFTARRRCVGKANGGLSRRISTVHAQRLQSLIPASLPSFHPPIMVTVIILYALAASLPFLFT